MGGQLEELILEARDELKLVEMYAKETCWERAPDLNWKAAVDQDIAKDIKREDAQNAAAGAGKK